MLIYSHYHFVASEQKLAVSLIEINDTDTRSAHANLAGTEQWSNPPLLAFARKPTLPFSNVCRASSGNHCRQMFPRLTKKLL